MNGGNGDEGFGEGDGVSGVRESLFLLFFCFFCFFSFYFPL